MIGCMFVLSILKRERGWGGGGSGVMENEGNKVGKGIATS